MTKQNPTYGVIDPDYARVFTIARCIAWSEGYALTMHGSFTRDLDLLAVPWTEQATEPEHLVRRIVSNLDDLDLLVKDPKAQSQATQKPHGRLAWTLTFKAFGDPRFVDLSVMPRSAASTLENGPAGLADATSNAPDPSLSSLRKGAEVVGEAAAYDFVAGWHERQAKLFREMADDEPRTADAARKRAAEAAVHHAASAAALRNRAADDRRAALVSGSRGEG